MTVKVLQTSLFAVMRDGCHLRMVVNDVPSLEEGRRLERRAQPRDQRGATAQRVAGGAEGGTQDSFVEVFQFHASAGSQALPCCLDPPQKPRVVLKTVVEPVIF